MIYRLRFDRFNYLVFDIAAYDIERTIGDIYLLNEPVWADFWKPLSARFSDDSDKGNVIKVPDITVWFTDRLALNQTAYNALATPLKAYGEFLPVSCEGIPYWILHPTKQTNLSAVNLSKSNREIDVEAQYIDVRSLAFNEDKVKDLLIFQNEYNSYKNIYCTEKFKSLIENAGLQGLIFSTDLAGTEEP